MEEFCKTHVTHSSPNNNLCIPSGLSDMHIAARNSLRSCQDDSSLVQRRTAILCKEASVMHPDIGLECQPEWCPVDWFVIRPKHLFSHFRFSKMGMPSKASSGQSICLLMKPGYLACVSKLHQSKNPIEYVPSDSVLQHMRRQHVWTSAEMQLAAVDNMFTHKR